MTGYELYKRAVNLLQIDDYPAYSGITLPQTVLNIINIIGADLIENFHIEDAYKEFSVSNEVLPALTFGVTMLLASVYGLDEKSAYFTELYNGKRAAAKSKSKTVKNVIPTV